MKGKRHKTEEIIRILRMADGGKTVDDVLPKMKMKLIGGVVQCELYTS